MLTYTKHALLALLLLAPSPALFAIERDNTEAKVEQLMQASGLKHVIERFPQEIEAQINLQKRSSPSTALSDEESKLLFSHFKSSTIYDSLKQYLSHKLNQQTLTTLLAMHDNSLMKRLVTAEVNASSSEHKNDMEAFINTLRHNPPTTSRIKLIQQLDRVAMSTESVLYIMQMMMLGMNEIMTSGQDKSNPSKRAQQQKVITDSTRLIEDELREQIIMSMHYIYRDFTDDELLHYIAELKRDESQHFTRVAIEGIGIIILDAFKHGMNQLLQRRNAKAA